MPPDNPFETSHPLPEADLSQKTRLIMRADVVSAAILLVSWLWLGLVPDTRNGTIALMFMVAATLTFGSASLIGWLRLSTEERTNEMPALMFGLLSFGLALLVFAFPFYHIMTG